MAAEAGVALGGKGAEGGRDMGGVHRQMVDGAHGGPEGLGGEGIGALGGQDHGARAQGVRRADQGYLQSAYQPKIKPPITTPTIGKKMNTYFMSSSFHSVLGTGIFEYIDNAIKNDLISRIILSLKVFLQPLRILHPQAL